MGSFPATYNDPSYLDWILKQSVYLAEYDLYNYVDLGGFYPSRPIDNTLH